MVQILRILHILVSLSLGTACPFTVYEQALLNQINPIQETQISLTTETMGDSIGFGFWSQCIPFWNQKYQKQVDNSFNTQIADDGQFLFLLKAKISQINVILSYVEFVEEIPSVDHKIVIHDTQQNHIISKSYPPLNYEGIWILTYFTLQLTQQIIIVEMSYQNKEVIQYSIEQGEYNLIIGGRGYISIGQQTFNLNSFLGRLSYLIYNQSFNYADNHFQQIEKLCEIPPKVIGVQEMYFIQGLKYFDGSHSSLFNVDQYGNRYAIFGWFKLDVEKDVGSFFCQIIRITAFKDLTDKMYQGDELFQLLYSVSKGSEARLFGIANQYNIPIITQLTLENYQRDNFNVDAATSSVSMYELIQEWHFIQFEYGRKQNCRTLISIYFSKLDKTKQLCLGTEGYQGQFTNTPFYVVIGGGTSIKFQNFIGYLYDIKFIYNYSSDLEFSISCHYSCSDCFGPLHNNCKSCPSNSNRLYLSEQRVCKCNQNYLDIDEQPICLEFSEAYPTIKESESPEIYSILCNFGYFQILTSDNQYMCVQCPQYQSNNINCADCQFHPKTWYSYPVCTQDVIAQINISENAFSFVQNEPINYDVYYIDQNYKPQLYVGVQSYCDPNEVPKDCFKTKVKNFGNEVNVICKQNHFFLEDQCILLDPYCVKVDSQNQQCLQCQNNYYLFENKCHNCPFQCQNCYYSNNKVNCVSCITRYALVNGDCQLCGRNCEVCLNFNDTILKTNYLRCYKCIDDQRYFLSLDAVNCLQNPIKNCQLAFQVLEENQKINSLDYYFVPQYSGNIKTMCAACERTYLFEIPTQSCIDAFNINCVVSVSNVENPGITDEICLFVENGYGFYQFQGLCYAFINNCDTCIYGRQNNFLQCLICNAGYYAQRLAGVCQLCPHELNCMRCQQQNKYIKDNWKITAQAFYRYAINSDFKHAFMMHGQSQNIDDYEVVCASCQPGYELYQDKCILSCPEKCLECQFINGQNICIKCHMDEFGRQLSLSNNNCIQCLGYCALCRVRAQEEIFQINPYFQSKQFIQSTYQCIRAYEQMSNLFYDQQLGQFIQCVNENCKRIFTIVLNLFCSITEYNQELAKSEDNILFKQNNILIHDLFSISNFIEVSIFNIQFESNQFYSNANQKSIKVIQIKIVSKKQQICTITGDVVLAQLFSSKIFSALNVEIEFLAYVSTTIKFDKGITFANFTLITFRNFIFQSIPNEKIKYIHFQSLTPQVISLSNCSYEQLNPQTDLMQIKFNNLYELELVNFNIVNLMMSSNDGFFIINGGEQFQQLTITGLTIQKSSLQNMDFLQIYGKNNALIMNHIQVIDSTFFHSKFIMFTYHISYGAQKKQSKLSLQNMIVQNSSIKSSKGCMDLPEISEIYLEGLTLKNSVFTQTIFILFGNNVYFQNFSIQGCRLQNETSLLQNLDNLQSEDIQINLDDFLIQKNQYDATVKFITLLSYSSKNQSVNINQFQFSNNEILRQINGLINYKSSLIYISFKIIIIKSLHIERGVGLPEFSLVNTDYLKIEDLSITQGDNYKFRALTRYLDCIQLYLTKPYYPPSLYILSSKVTIIKNINIHSIYTSNQPLIFVSFPDAQNSWKNSQILIQDGRFTSNIIIIQEQLLGVGLVFIQSNQFVQIIMSNLTFFGNVLHEYVQSELLHSAALININCLQCEVKLISLIFTSNSVFNSTDSINYINSQSIYIDECIFESNSLFQYEIIRPFLIWGKNIIYLEQLELIFKILSNSGNGVFLSQDMKIMNSQVFQSAGQQGGAFKIRLRAESNLECNNTLFDSIQILFTKGVQSGGILNIDTQYSSSSIIRITNLQIKNSFSSSLGGVLYINNGKGELDIQIQRLQIQNVYAKLGSIIYCSFLSGSSHFQRLQINEILYFNDLEYFADFLSKFTATQKQEISEILNQRSLIYIEDGTIVILQNFQIQNIYYESFLYGQSLSNIIIKDIMISNSIITPNLINIVPNASNYINNLDQYFTLGIENCQVQDSKQIRLSYEFFQCFQRSVTIPAYQFQCENIFTVQILPENLSTLKKNNSQALIECFKEINLYQITDNQTDSGIISIANLNQVEYISISNIIFKNITCKFCNKGLVSLLFLQNTLMTHQVQIEQIQIYDSQCGNGGCIIISKGESESLIETQSSFFALDYELHIFGYICVNNTASFGTCLNIKSFSSILNKCIFKGNLAKNYGGAIHLIGSQSKFIISDSIITSNFAEIGGGIYSPDSVLNNFQLFNTILEHNGASFYGDEQASVPLFIKLSINQTIGNLQNYLIAKNDNLFIQGVLNQNTIIHLPSGQQISEYYYYDWQTQSYIYPGLSLRLRAVDEYDTIYKDLVNHYCSIKSRVFNTSSNDDIQFTNDFTNIKELYFNNNTQDFNLDNLIIYFDSDQPQNIVLQLEFQCSPIIVPIFNEQAPYNLLKTHKNYYLRVNIRTLPCTFGQIKNITDQSCHMCNSRLNQFSLNINAYKCQIIDEITTISAESAKLQLRQFYWRPYFDISDITYCLNLPENCNGGWVSGDNSCITGNIGALCEQCDLYNIKGEGYYSISQKYTCGLCSSTNLNLGVMLGTIIWTLLSLILSVRSTLQTAQKHIKQAQSKILGFTVFYKIAQSGVIIKILTNYLQIIASLSTFQLHLPINISNMINVFGNPIQSISYSQDCIISKFWSIQIHYARIIWQLLLPFFFYGIFFIGYLILVKINTLIFNFSVLSTSVLYLFIYFQPNWIYELISLISFRNISGFQWIQNNVAYRYDTSIHQQWILQFCLPILILLILVIPLILLFGLIFNRHKLNNKQTKIIWGFLYNEYRLTSYFWEIIKIVEKDLIIIVLVYYEEYVIIKGILVIFIVQLYQVLNSNYKPYHLYKFNQIDMQTANICQISFIFGVGIYISDQHQIKQIKNVFYVLLALLNIYQFISLFFEIIKAYVVEAEGFIDKIRNTLSSQIPEKYKNKFMLRLLKNKTESRKKIEENFIRLKSHLLIQARIIIQLKQSYNYKYQTKSTNNFLLKKQLLFTNESKVIQNNALQSISQGSAKFSKTKFLIGLPSSSSIQLPAMVKKTSNQTSSILEHNLGNDDVNKKSNDLKQIPEEEDVHIDI